MKIIRKIFFAFIFLIQVMLALTIYAYSAHYWSLGLTILIAVVESIITIWSFNRLFKKKSFQKNNLKKHQGIVKKIDSVKNRSLKSYSR